MLNKIFLLILFLSSVLQLVHGQELNLSRLLIERRLDGVGAQLAEEDRLVLERLKDDPSLASSNEFLDSLNNGPTKWFVCALRHLSREDEGGDSICMSHNLPFLLFLDIRKDDEEALLLYQRRLMTLYVSRFLKDLTKAERSIKVWEVELVRQYLPALFLSNYDLLEKSNSDNEIADLLISLVGADRNLLDAINYEDYLSEILGKDKSSDEVKSRANDMRRDLSQSRRNLYMANTIAAKPVLFNKYFDALNKCIYKSMNENDEIDLGDLKMKYTKDGSFLTRVNHEALNLSQVWNSFVMVYPSLEGWEYKDGVISRSPKKNDETSIVNSYADLWKFIEGLSEGEASRLAE